jgi:hypothetical protein
MKIVPNNRAGVVVVDVVFMNSQRGRSDLGLMRMEHSLVPRPEPGPDQCAEQTEHKGGDSARAPDATPCAASSASARAL